MNHYPFIITLGVPLKENITPVLKKKVIIIDMSLDWYECK